jgi:4-hydroxy-3-polyprenylbenzoate decarboxylase
LEKIKAIMGGTTLLEITVAITGASGAIYPQRFLNHLLAESAISKINLIASTAGIRVLNEELPVAGVNARNLAKKLLPNAGAKVEVFNPADVGARMASGSSPVDAMVVIPCSMGTLGSIAHGISRDLIQRAADVMLKERKKLLLVTRDTPLNLIHLENMRQATLAGAIIIPACPAFYPGPNSIEEAVDQFLFRIMLQLGLNPAGLYRWEGSAGWQS